MSPLRLLLTTLISLGKLPIGFGALAFALTFFSCKYFIQPPLESADTYSVATALGIAVGCLVSVIDSYCQWSRKARNINYENELIEAENLFDSGRIDEAIAKALTAYYHITTSPIPADPSSESITKEKWQDGLWIVEHSLAFARSSTGFQDQSDLQGWLRIVTELRDCLDICRARGGVKTRVRKLLSPKTLGLDVADLWISIYRQRQEETRASTPPLLPTASPTVDDFTGSGSSDSKVGIRRPGEER